MEERTKVSIVTKSGPILECPAQIRYKTLNPFTYAPIPSWQPQPPFWYKTYCENEEFYGKLEKNINEYSFSKLPQPEKFMKISEEMQIERPERYLPGEIYKAKKPKDAVTMGSAVCPNVWKPKSDIFYTDFDTRSLKLRPLLEDDIVEQAERSKEILTTQSSHDMTERV